MKCVVFLQNAWSPVYAGHEWPRERWLPAFKASLSGRRLARVFLDPARQPHFDNTTAQVSPNPSGVCPPDPDHILRVLREEAPDVVVACGLQALEAVGPLWGGNLLAIPHPAWRFITNELLDVAREILDNPPVGRTRVAALPGGVVLVSALPDFQGFLLDAASTEARP